MSNVRIESDSIGTMEVPADAYYGVQTLRGYLNFHITGNRMHDMQINMLAALKKASAYANNRAGILDRTICDAIIQACDEIMYVKLHDQFIVYPIQGGAVTSANMNDNEVIAN
ncbi:MAG: aspartate ammonia-lyase, partial [Clostridia bacterium]|nr:aspartate ammonia-lyase [Clostridia bacterium]